MKSHVADWQTRVYCVRIEPANDAPIVRLAGYPTALIMSNGAVYATESGYEFSGQNGGVDFAPGSLDLSGILQAGAINRADLMAGRYDNARVYLFATSWANPVEDEEPLGLYFFGAVEITDDRYKVQLMGAIDVLSQNVGRTYSATCPWTLFDRTLDGRTLLVSQSRCTGPRAAPDGPNLDAFKVGGALTSVTSQLQFADSSRAEAEDWFAYGAIRFLTGANAGLKPMEIKRFSPGGAIEVMEAFFYLPAVGDEYEMIPGCRKRLQDCREKYGNVKNFGGQPHVPVPSVAAQVGRGA